MTTKLDLGKLQALCSVDPDIRLGGTFIVDNITFEVTKLCDEPDTGLAVIEQKHSIGKFGFTLPIILIRELMKAQTIYEAFSELIERAKKADMLEKKLKDAKTESSLDQLIEDATDEMLERLCGYKEKLNSIVEELALLRGI